MHIWQLNISGDFLAYFNPTSIQTAAFCPGTHPSHVSVGTVLGHACSTSVSEQLPRSFRNQSGMYGRERR
jgi:hypothetical protein